MHVCYEGRLTFQGWWQQLEKRVHTVVAAKPGPLDNEPPYLIE
jgi:hypothetical protein